MMRRIAALLAGLMLVAGTVAAQSTAPGCARAVVSRVAVKPDSTRTLSALTCKNVHDTLRIVRVDTVYVPVKDTTPTPPPPPPADTTPTPPPPPPVDTTPKPAGTLFSSDWSRGLLDTAQVIRNAANTRDSLVITKWTRWGGQGVLAIVPATGLDFPSANVLRVAMGTGSFDWVEANGKWTLPAVGEARAFRLYFRNEIGAINGGWSATHPVESKGTDGGISGSFYTWKLGSRADGRGQWAFQTTAGQPRNLVTLGDRTGADIGTLAKNVTYRVEWKWTRTGASAYTLDLRISDPTGKVVADNTNLYPWGSTQPLSTQATGFSLADWAVTGVRVGINGGFSASGSHYVYYGGFAVCTDWCGK